MKKLRILFLIFLVLITLSACQKTYRVTLLNADDNIYEEYKRVGQGSVLELPVLTGDNVIFLGWSDGETTYYGEIIVNEDLVLTAQYEFTTEVFEFTIVEKARYEQCINIIAYNGDATHLVIPEAIYGYPVGNIDSYAFDGSTLIEVWIPNTVLNISEYAFNNSALLEAVHFYGDYYGTHTRIIYSDSLESMLQENPDTCQVESVDEENGITYYNEGCIVMASKLYNTVVINGVESNTYQVALDAKLYIPDSNKLILDYAFEGAVSLKTLEINSHTTLITGLVLAGTPSLENIIVNEDNEKYTSIDGILYSKDLSSLIYVPSSAIDDTGVFDIPETVTCVTAYSFYDNTAVKTINIPTTVTSMYANAFLKTTALEEINLEGMIDDYFSVDGILFYQSDSNTALAFYPANRAGSSYIIPDGITMIGINAFSYNKNLEEIDLGSEITVIGQSAFIYSENLTVIDIPSSVEYVRNYITKDSSIEVVIFRGTSETVIPSIFGDFYNSDGTQPDIFIPDDSLDDYIEKNPNNTTVSQFQQYSDYIEE